VLKAGFRKCHRRPQHGGGGTTKSERTCGGIGEKKSLFYWRTTVILRGPCQSPTIHRKKKGRFRSQVIPCGICGRQRGIL